MEYICAKLKYLETLYDTKFDIIKIYPKYKEPEENIFVIPDNLFEEVNKYPGLLELLLKAVYKNGLLEDSIMEFLAKLKLPLVYPKYKTLYFNYHGYSHYGYDLVNTGEDFNSDGVLTYDFTEDKNFKLYICDDLYMSAEIIKPDNKEDILEILEYKNNEIKHIYSD